MTHYGMLIDVATCAGCNACTMACKYQNATPHGMYWCKVLMGEYGTYPNSGQTVLPISCQHCTNAPCVRACPTGASHYDENGNVQVDYDKCIGCRMCMAACPYGARIQIKKTGVIEKCRFCWYEGEPGNPPRCVGTCISGARLFGDLDDPQSEICQEIARTNAQPLAGDLTTAKIYYVR